MVEASERLRGTSLQVSRAHGLSDTATSGHFCTEHIYPGREAGAIRCEQWALDRGRVASGHSCGVSGRIRCAPCALGNDRGHVCLDVSVRTR